ncbi:MAG TPA: GNAT family N-acetyltransferase [Tepidisphaeraceae bacterium]|nr:GNAT family N-acetyltransferase [Tepidisphaeraceae bacterium]
MTELIARVDRDLTYRRMDAVADAALAYENYRQTCIASFGNEKRCIAESAYFKWLAKRIEEYPDGHVLALLRGEVIGQMELQIPYGLDRGYVNLFYVGKPWRRLGFGRRLHDYALHYFRSWEAAWIELHVSSTNSAATAFYRSLGYRLSEAEREGERMWRMERAVLP